MPNVRVQRAAAFPIKDNKLTAAAPLQRGVRQLEDITISFTGKTSRHFYADGYCRINIIPEFKHTRMTYCQFLSKACGPEYRPPFDKTMPQPVL
ncbi:MAG: hypothetical protein IPM66_14415 [Acidobacteriota bacterium]|nr:MAG: hypothetical protein IPM66_14415 [Acidobacteriota bacterium]